MTSEEVIQRLRGSKSRVARISRETGVPYGSLRKIVTGETKDPRGSTLDTLREYFERAQPDGRPQ